MDYKQKRDLDIDIEKTRLLALSTSVNLRQQEKASQPSESPNETWTGEDVYNYMQANRHARFADTEEGDMHFDKMAKWMEERSIPFYHGIGEALGSMFDEMSDIVRAPSVMFDPKKSLAVSTAEGAARGVRDIATIVWQSEDPNSFFFNAKSWINRLSGDNDGNIKAQKAQYHAARDWNNRTYDYMEGKATQLGDLFADQKDFFQRAIDPHFATAFSWIATDIPEWILSGGVATAGSAIKAAAKGGIEASMKGARAASKRSAFLANNYLRISNFAKGAAGQAIEATGEAIQKPFQYLYGARAAVDEVAGSAIGAAAENVATTKMLELGSTVVGNQLQAPALGIFRSLGIESIGEVMSAYGSEIAERALGIARVDPNTIGMTAMEAVASNMGGKMAGKMSKEALALARGINYTLGWAPSMASEVLRESTRNAVIGGALGWMHSEEAVGQGIGIGAAYGAGFGSIRNMLAYTHYGHQDGVGMKNLEESGIPALERLQGSRAAQYGKRFLEWHKQRIREDAPGAMRFAGTEASSLSQFLREGATATPAGNVLFWFGDATTELGRADLENYLIEVGRYDPSLAKREAESMAGSHGRYIEPKGAAFSSHMRRVVAINEGRYNGMALTHEVSHAMIRSAAYRLGWLDQNGMYTDEALKRFFGAEKDQGLLNDATLDMIGTSLFALSGRVNRVVEGPNGMRAAEKAVSYHSLLRSELAANKITDPEAVARYEAENTARIQQTIHEAYSSPLNDGGSVFMREDLRLFRSDLAEGTTTAVNAYRMNLSTLMDEIMAYTHGASTLALPSDYWNSNKGAKNILKALGEYLGERRHSKMISDLELAGVFVKEQFDKNGNKLMDADGNPMLQTLAFDNGRVVRFEALEQHTKRLIQEAADLTAQPVHTLSPAKQEVIAKMTGQTRYFDPVPGGMRIKQRHEREAIATQEAKRALDVLNSLSDQDKPRIEITEKGSSVRLEDMTDAAWEALSQSGIYSQIEINSLKGLSKVIQLQEEGSAPHNVFTCSLMAASYQIGTAATSERLKGKDVPVTDRTFVPLSVELFFDSMTPDGRPSRKQNGGIRVHSFDILAENKRLMATWEKPEVRQYFDSFQDYIDKFHGYISNNSSPASIRLSTEEFLKKQYGMDARTAVAVRDIFYETFGGRKRKDASYINVPGENYKVPGDNRLYPYYTMRFDTMWDVQLSPASWNPNSLTKRFPYVHKHGYDPITRNNMISGFVTKPKANGEYLKDRNGFEIHEVKGKYRMFDPFGNKVGDFQDLKRAVKMAGKLTQKLDDDEHVPAAVDAATHDFSTFDVVGRDMIATNLGRLTRQAIAKHGTAENWFANVKIQAAKNSNKPYSIRLSDVVGDDLLLRIDLGDGTVEHRTNYGRIIIGPSFMRSESESKIRRSGPGGSASTAFSNEGDFVFYTSAYFDELSKMGEAGLNIILSDVLYKIKKNHETLSGILPTQEPIQALAGAALIASSLGESISAGINNQLMEGATMRQKAEAKFAKLQEQQGKWVQRTEELLQDFIGEKRNKTSVLPSPNREVQFTAYAAKLRPDSEQRVLQYGQEKQIIKALGKHLRMSEAAEAMLENTGRTDSLYQNTYVFLIENVEAEKDDLKKRQLMLDLSALFDSPEQATAFIESHSDLDKASLMLHERLLDLGIVDADPLTQTYGRVAGKIFREKLQFYTARRGKLVEYPKLNTTPAKLAAQSLLTDVRQINQDKKWITLIRYGGGYVDLMTGETVVSELPTHQLSVPLAHLNLDDPTVSRFYKLSSIEEALRTETDPEAIAELLLLHSVMTIVGSGEYADPMHELLRSEGERNRAWLYGSGKGQQEVANAAIANPRYEGDGQSWKRGDVPGSTLHIPSTGNLRTMDRDPYVLVNNNSNRGQRIERLKESRAGIAMGGSIVLLSDAWSRGSFKISKPNSNIWITLGDRKFTVSTLSTDHETAPRVTTQAYNMSLTKDNVSIDHPSIVSSSGMMSMSLATMMDNGVTPTLKEIEKYARRDFKSIESYLRKKFGKKLDAFLSGLESELITGVDYGRTQARFRAEMMQMGISTPRQIVFANMLSFIKKYELAINDPARPLIGDSQAQMISRVGKQDAKRVTYPLTYHEDYWQLAVSMLEEGLAPDETSNYNLTESKVPSPKDLIKAFDASTKRNRLAYKSLQGTKLLTNMRDQFRKAMTVRFGPVQGAKLEMLVGSTALRRMQQLRREELISRGLVKILRLGNGTEQAVWELSDERAQLRMRYLGDRVINMITKGTSKFTEDRIPDLIKTFLASLGDERYLEDFSSSKFQMPRAYAQLPDDTKQRVKNAQMALVSLINEMNGPTGSPFILANIFSHEELYELYPNLGNMPVVFSATSAGYSSDGRIHLPINLLLRDELAEGNHLEGSSVDSGNMDQKTPSSGAFSYQNSLRAVILHEIQHAIQDAEQWATASPWVQMALSDQNAESGTATMFGGYADQLVALEGIMGGTGKTPILANVSTTPSHIEGARERIMRTWGQDMKLISLDPDVSKFAVLATPEEAAQALERIIRAPKSQVILTEAIPNYISFLHTTLINVETQIEARKAMGKAEGKDYEFLVNFRKLIVEKAIPDSAALQDMIEVGVPLTTVVTSISKMTQTLADGMTHSLRDPAWGSVVTRETLGSYDAFSNVKLARIKVAHTLAKIAMSLEPGEVVTPVKAQLLMIKLMNAMGRHFYAMSDTEVMARQTATRSMLSQAEIDSGKGTRTLSFNDPADKAMYDLALFMAQGDERGPYSLDMIGGLRGSPKIEVNLAPGQPLNHFAAAIRLAARMSLYGVALQSISANIKDALDFSARGWVLENVNGEDKLVYRVSTGTLRNISEEGQRKIQSMVEVNRQAGELHNQFQAENLFNSEFGQGIFRSSPRDQEGTHINIAGVLTETAGGGLGSLDLERLGEYLGATVAYDSMTSTPSNVMNYLMQNDSPDTFVGGTIRDVLMLADLSEDDVRMANIDHIDNAFDGIALSKYELLDMLATVHDVTFSSTSRSPSDPISNYTGKGVSAELKGKIVKSIYKTDPEFTKRVLRDVLAPHSSYSELFRVEHAEGSAGAMFMVSAVKTYISLRDTSVWQKLMKTMESSGAGKSEAFLNRLFEKLQRVAPEKQYSEYDRAAMARGAKKPPPIATLASLGTFSEEELEARAQAYIDHLYDIMRAVTPLAVKMHDKIMKIVEESEMTGSQSKAIELFADAVSEVIRGAAQGSGLQDILPSSRGSSTLRIETGISQPFMAPRRKSTQGIVSIAADEYRNSGEIITTLPPKKRAFKKLGKMLGLDVKSMQTGGIPIRGALSVFAGDQYNQFVSGSYIGLAFPEPGLLPRRSSQENTASFRSVSGDSDKIFGEPFRDINNDSLTKRFKHKAYTTGEILKSSGVDVTYSGPGVIRKTAGELEFGILSERGVAVQLRGEQLFDEQIRTVLDLGQSEGLVDLRPVYEAVVKSIYQLAFNRTEAASQHVIDDTYALGLLHNLMQARAAGYWLLNSAYEATRTLDMVMANDGDRLFDAFAKSVRNVENTTNDVPAGRELSRNLTVNQVLNLTEQSDISSSVAKSRAYFDLANLVTYRADNFGMMSVGPVLGSEIARAINNWDNPRYGISLDEEVAETRGFRLPSSNAALIRGSIADVGPEGQKTLVIQNVSSLAEPPTSKQVEAINTAAGQVTHRKAVRMARSQIDRNLSMSFDLAFRGDVTDLIYTPAINSFDDAEVASQAYLPARLARLATVVPALQIVTSGDNSFEFGNLFKGPSSSPRIQGMLQLGDDTNAPSMFSGIYTQIGLTHGIAAVAELQGTTTQERFVLLRTIVGDIVGENETAYWDVSDPANVTFKFDERFAAVYKGRKIKKDPRILLLGRPSVITSGRKAGEVAHNDLLLLQNIPGVKEAYSEAEATARMVMMAMCIQKSAENLDADGMKLLQSDPGNELLKHVIDGSDGNFEFNWNVIDKLRTFAASYMATPAGFARYNDLVGAIFLEKTLLKWLATDSTFLPHLEEEDRARIIHAYRRGYATYSPSQFNVRVVQPSQRLMTPEQRRTIFNVSSLIPTEESHYGIKPTTPEGSGHIERINDGLFSIFRGQSDDARFFGNAQEVARALVGSGVLQELFAARSIAITRPLFVINSEISFQRVIPNKSDSTFLLGSGNYGSVRHGDGKERVLEPPAQIGAEGQIVDVERENYGSSGPQMMMLRAETVTNPLKFDYENWSGRSNTFQGAHGRPVRVTGDEVAPALIALNKTNAKPETVLGEVLNSSSDITSVKASVPRTSVSSSVARTRMHRLIVNEAAKSGAETVDVAPANNIFTKVVLDLPQAAAQISLKNAQATSGDVVLSYRHRSTYHARGMKAIAKTVSATYTRDAAPEGVNRESLAQRQKTVPEISAQSAALGGFANPFDLAETPYQKGYAWKKMPDGTIILNISGDILGYKTGISEFSNDLFGFNLHTALGIDLNAGTISPARYSVHAQLYDISNRIRSGMAKYLDPHLPAVEKARFDHALGYDKRHVGIFSTQFGFIDDLSVGRKPDAPIPFDYALTPSQLVQKLANNEDPVSRQVAAASLNGHMQPSSYITLSFPPGTTIEQIKAAIVSAHVDVGMQATIHTVANNFSREGLVFEGITPDEAMSYGLATDKRRPEVGNLRKYAGPITSNNPMDVFRSKFNNTEIYGSGASDVDILKMQVESAMQFDPHLMSDIDILVGRMVSEDSSYFVPDSERIVRTHGDTGAAIATLFPGRPDLLDYSWDAKRARGISVWKRTVPRGVNASNYAKFVVTFKTPVDFVPEGAVRMNDKSIAFVSEAQANEFANRISMQSSGSDLVRALASGEATIVPRPDKQLRRYVSKAHTVHWEGQGKMPNLIMLDGRYVIGEAELVGVSDIRQAEAIGSALSQNKHIRFKPDVISLDMAGGLTSLRDYQDLVTAKANFGLPHGPAKFGSRAMHVISKGLVRRAGTWRDFNELKGSEWLQLMKDNGVTKDELRQSGLGALFINNEARSLSRLEVAEFFATTFPTLLRHDFSVNENLFRSAAAYARQSNTVTFPSRANVDHLAVSVANRLSAINALYVRYNQLIKMVSELDPDDPSVAEINRAINAFEQTVIPLLGEETQSNVTRNGYQGLLDSMATEFNRTADLLNPENIPLSSIELREKINVQRSLDYSPFELARLKINEVFSGVQLSEDAKNKLGPMFSEMSPFIDHAFGNINLHTDLSGRDVHGVIHGRFPMVLSQERMASLEFEDGKRSFNGQVLRKGNYFHAGYVSGNVHSQTELIADFARTSLGQELPLYLAELRQRLAGAPDDQKDKIRSMISAAESVVAARLAQKALGDNRREVGGGHFGDYIGGLFGPRGMYEISHIRQSFVLGLGQPSLFNLTEGVGGVFANRAPDELPFEPIVEPMTVIEEIQSDLFQKIDEASELPGTMLPLEKSDVDIPAKMTAAETVAKDVNALEAAIENLDETIVKGLVEDLMPNDESNISSDIGHTLVNVILERVDLVSRGFMSANFPLFLRDSGRRVKTTEGVKNMLKRMGGIEAPEMMPVFDWDFDLMYAASMDGMKLSEQTQQRMLENMNAAKAFLPQALREKIPVFQAWDRMDSRDRATVSLEQLQMIKRQALVKAAQQDKKYVVDALDRAVNAASESGLAEDNQHLTRFLSAVRDACAHATSSEVMVQGMLIAYLASDPAMNAMLREIADNPDGFDYEAMARRALDSIRLHSMNAKSITTRAGLLALENLLRLPSQDRPTLTALNKQVIYVEKRLPGEFLADGGHIGAIAENVNIGSDSLQASIERLAEHYVHKFFFRTDSATHNPQELRKKLLAPDDATPGRFLISADRMRGGPDLMFKKPGQKSFMSYPYTPDGLRSMIRDVVLADIKKAGVLDEPAQNYTGIRIKYDLNSVVIQWGMPYRGSVAGDLAKSVAYHLTGYERAGDLPVQLEKKKAELAQLQKGIPKPAMRPDRALSLSTPFIEKDLTLYKTISVNHAVIESINRGQKSLGILDASYQMSRGGRLSNDFVSPDGALLSVSKEKRLMQIRHRGVAIALGALSKIHKGNIPWKKDGAIAKISNLPFGEVVESITGDQIFLKRELLDGMRNELMQMIVEAFGEGSPETSLVHRELQNFSSGSIITNSERQTGIDMRQPLVGPDGKPIKQSKESGAFATMAISSPLFNAPENFRPGGVAYGYVLNYGLPQHYVTTLFPGVTKKTTDLFNIDAFDRPLLVTSTTDPNILTVVDPKTGNIIASADIRRPDGMARLREAYLKASKYVGGNLMLKTFLKEWSPAGGYADYIIVGAGLANEVNPIKQAGEGEIFASGQGMITTFKEGGIPTTESFERTFSSTLGGYAMEKMRASRAEVYEKLKNAGFSPSRSDQDDPGSFFRLATAGMGSAPRHSTYAPLGTGALSSNEFSTLYGKTHHQFVSDAHIPFVIRLVHTPASRTEAEVKAYVEKLNRGVFLQMVAGTDAATRKDKTSMDKVARYLANAGHIPRLRAEQEENETAY